MTQIVVLENIKRRIDNGESVYDGSILGAKQITFVVVVTTIVLISVFYHFHLWREKLEDYS